MRIPMASMLEGFVSQLLADYLSNYVQGIHPEQFRLGIWTGVAQLENVELRLEAFDYLQLPFAMKKGVVGKLKLQVPWTKLGREPILIGLEDVFICACPQDEFEWNSEALEARSLAAKKAKLAAAELAKLSARISQHVSDDNPSQSFLSHLSTKIIDNVQVTAQNVHFRYIDQKTDPQVAFSFGITFTCLTINNDYAFLGTTSGKSRANQVNKLMEIKELAIYWNSDETDRESFAEEVDGGLFTALPAENKWIYIVQPFDVSLRFMVNKSSLFDGSTPQYSVVLDTNNLSFTVEDQQLHEMLLVWDSLSICKMREKYGHCRPAVGQHGYNRRESGWQNVWWHYAIQAVLTDVHRKLHRNSWSYLEWRMNMRRQYVELYELRLDCLRKGKPAADQNLCRLEELEKQLDLEEILSFRSIAEDRLQGQQNAPQSISDDNLNDTNVKESTHEIKSDDQPSQKKRSWLNYLSLGMLGAAGSTVAGGQFAAVLPDEIIEDIYEATKYHPIGLKEHGDLPKGYCRVVATLCIGGVSVTLRGLCPKEDIASMDIQVIEARMKVWQQSTNFFISIGTLEAVDLSEKKSTFPIFLGSKGSILPYFSEQGHPQFSYAEAVSGVRRQRNYSAHSISGSDAVVQSVGSFGGPLIVVEVELLLDDKEFDMIAKIQTQPLEFVYIPKLIKHIGNFLSRPASHQTITELMFSSLNRLQSPHARMQSKAELVLTMRKRICLKAQLLRPVLIFPENLQSKDCTHLVIILKSVQITSTKQPSNSLLDRKFGKILWPQVSNVEGAGLNLCLGVEKEVSCKGDYKGAGEEHWCGDIAYQSLYYQFQLQLCNVQVILASHAYSWQECWNDPNQLHKLHFVELFDAEVLLEISALSDEPTLTRFKISGNLPALKVLLSSRKWKALRTLFADHQEYNDLPKNSMRDAFEMHVRNALEHGIIPCGADEPEVLKKGENLLQTSRGVANLELSIKAKTFKLSFLSGEDESSVSAHENGILLGQGEDASLMFIHCDSQQELQFEVDIRQVEKTVEQLNDNPFMMLHSASRLFVMATFMPTTVWKWKWVASQISIILRRLSTPQEQIAVAHFKDMELAGSTKNNCFEALTCKVFQLWIHSSEHHSDNTSCASDCLWPPSIHSCLLYTLKQQCCNEECGHTIAIQPGLEINVSLGSEMEKHLLISIPFVIVCLHLTAWARTIQAFAQYMDTFITPKFADQNALIQKNWYYPEHSNMLKSQHLNEEGFRSTPTNNELGSCLQTSRETTANLPGCTIFLMSSIIVVSFVVPDLDWATSMTQKSDMPRSFVCNKCLRTNIEVKDAASENYTESDQQMEKYISFKLTLQVDNIVYDDSTCHYKASILKGEVNLNRGLVERSPGLALLQIADVRVEGRIDLKNNEKLDVTVVVMAKRVDIWCSFPILCFLRSFKFETYESSDPMLAFDANICATLQRGSFLLTDGRWSCNAPVFEVRTRNSNIQTSWKTDRLDLHSSSEIEADYNNMEKVTWEPLLEPWNVCCSVSRTLGPFNRVFQAASRISSSCQLNVNITKALLQAASRAVDVLYDASNNMNSLTSDCSNDHSKSRGNNVSLGYAPYWLQNDTGVSITYWLFGSSKLEDDDSFEGKDFGGSSQNILHPGCSIPLYIDETPDQFFRKSRVNSSSERLVDKKTYSAQHRMICVQIEGTARASPPMSIDLVGSRFFSVAFSHSSTALDDIKKIKERQVLERNNTENGEGDARPSAFCTPVVFEVSALRYSKFIRIYSTVGLVNATSIPMEVRFDIPFGILPKVMKPILPGQVMPLPVHLAETGQIRWRPMGSSHLWSEAQSLSHILSPASKFPTLRSFACYPVHPSNAPFRCCIIVNEALAPSMLSTSMLAEGKKYNLQTHQKDTNSNSEEQNDLKRGSTRTPTYASSAGILREITFQAPLILRNCLPLPISLDVESGAGVTRSVCASEGDSVFVFEVNTAHDLTLTINVPGFYPASTRLVSAMSPPELQRDAQEDQVRSVETLDLLPVAPEGNVVYAKIEKLLNLVCGARELSVYVPLWFYNCSGLNLGLVGSESDSLSGKGKHMKEQVIAGYLPGTKGGESLVIESFGLQSVLQMPTEVPTGDSTRIFAHRHCCATAAVRSFGGKNIISCVPRKLNGVKDEISDSERANLKAHIYSPFKDEELTDKRMRVRISPFHSRKGTFDLGSREARWSRPFSLILPGGMTSVVVPDSQGEGAFILSIVSVSALGACAGKTRTVTFQPRFVLVNTCNQDLCYRQQGTGTFNQLLKGGDAHLHWSDTSRPLLVSVRFDQHGWDWSGGFVPDQLGDTQLKVRNLLTGATQMLRVEVQNASLVDNEVPDITSTDNSLGTYLILLSDDDSGFMPYRIDNFSQERLRFYQLKCPNFETTLLPYSSCSYAWDEPWRPHRLVLEIPGEGCLGTFDLDEVKEYPSAHLLSTHQKPERRFSISVIAEGSARVLTFQDIITHPKKDPFVIMPEKGLRNSTQGQDHDMHCTDEINLSFSSIGISIIDSSPQEMVFVCARGITLQLLQSPNQQKLNMNVSYIQVDNQLLYAQYPVMISVGLPYGSTNVPMEGNESHLETVQCQTGAPFEFTSGGAFTLIVAKWRHLASSVDCFQQIDVRIAQVKLQLDERIICCLFEFFRTLYELRYPPLYLLNTGSDNYASFASVDRSISISPKYELLIDSTSHDRHFIKMLRHEEVYKSWPALQAVKYVQSQKQKLLLLARGGRKVYIETLYVSPIEVTVSFSSASWLLNHGASTQPLLWTTGASVQRGLMALVDVESAPVQLRQLYLAHPLARWDAIRSMLIRHYTRQLLQETYKVLGYAGLLGNPVGFVRSLGSGVRDFVSAPARSFIQSPRQLVGGITRGTQSLLSNTVFAVSNAATLMSRAARKGVTAFALNHEYAAEMKRHQQAYGFQDYGVISELLEGLTGLLQSPVTGAERHGIPGMLSGVAVGAVGLVARPVASLLEVAGRTAQSIRSWSQPIQRQERRIRPPRYLSRDCPLLPYSWEEAVGNAVLVEAVGSRLEKEIYITCRPLAECGKFILLTETLLLKVTSANLSSNPSHGRLGPEWTIDSEIALEDILHVETEGSIVNILMGSPRCPPRTKRTFKKKQLPIVGPLLHESVEMTQNADAEELVSIVNYLIDEYFKGKPRFVIS